MSNYKKTLFYVFLFSIAFGYLEGAVVVYLRALYYPEGFSFPIKIITGKIIAVEFIREFATLLMILSVSLISGKNKMERFAYFMYIFGIWDIVYYIVLKLSLNWPESLLTYDILFFLPTVWIGPVLAPILVSICLITAGVLIVYFVNNNYTIFMSFYLWILEILAGVIVFISFITSAGDVINGKKPEHFYWWLFLLGLFLGILTFLYSVYKTLKYKKEV